MGHSVRMRLGPIPPELIWLKPGFYQFQLFARISRPVKCVTKTLRHSQAIEEEGPLPPNEKIRTKSPPPSPSTYPPSANKRQSGANKPSRSAHGRKKATQTIFKSPPDNYHWNKKANNLIGNTTRAKKLTLIIPNLVFEQLDH